jgi:hypothetical protein
MGLLCKYLNYLGQPVSDEEEEEESLLIDDGRSGP